MKEERQLIQTKVSKEKYFRVRNMAKYRGMTLRFLLEKWLDAEYLNSLQDQSRQWLPR